MQILIAKNYEDMSKQAAKFVAEQVSAKPNSTLGLATGSTPLLMYQELIKIYNDKMVDFSEITTFNLDEYLSLANEHENSYYYYMYHHFFNHINIKKENIYLPNGMANDIEQECLDYEGRMKEKGGIDLQILGIGKNGHIGFNEPDVKFEAITHKVKLDEETIYANARFFDSVAAVPRFAISMGIKTIMQAKKILLLVSGEDKKEAIYRTVFKEITPEVPASILQVHFDVTAIVDEKAGELLMDKQKQEEKAGTTMGTYSVRYACEV